MYLLILTTEVVFASQKGLQKSLAQRIEEKKLEDKTLPVLESLKSTTEEPKIDWKEAVATFNHSIPTRNDPNVLIINRLYQTAGNTLATIFKQKCLKYYIREIF